MTSLLKKLSLKRSLPSDHVETAEPAITDEKTASTQKPTRRPPAEIAEDWKHLHVLEKRFAEEEKASATATAEFEKQTKELGKSESKSAKALDKAESEVEKACKQLEKHEVGSSKHQDAAEEHARASAELETKRNEHHEAAARSRAAAEQVGRAKEDQITQARQHAEQLDAATPRDAFTIKRAPMFRVPPP